MVIGLWHTRHGDASCGFANPEFETAMNIMPLYSEDHPGKNYLGFMEPYWVPDSQRDHDWNWWMARDGPRSVAFVPPGLALALRHSLFHATLNDRVTAYGLNPVADDAPTGLGLRRRHGGDLGADSGQGFSWYEAEDLDGTFDAWDYVEEHLPEGTILGLTHVPNLGGQVRVFWRDRWYDPTDTNERPPAGFRRLGRWDEAGKAGQGYVWYEKTTGPKLFLSSAAPYPVELPKLGGRP